MIDHRSIIVLARAFRDARGERRVTAEHALITAIAAPRGYYCPHGPTTDDQAFAVDAWVAEASRRGGAREGAGRRPSPEGRTAVTLNLTDAARARLAQEPAGSRSAWVSALIERAG